MEALIKYQETNLTIRIFRCYGLADTDGRRNISDPYVSCALVRLSDSPQRTTRVQNSLSPSWSREDGTMILPGATGLDEVAVKVWDDDYGYSADDLLGEVTIPLSAMDSGSRQSELLLQNGPKRGSSDGSDSTIVLSWSRDVKAPAVIPDVITEDDITTLLQSVPERHRTAFVEEMRPHMLGATIDQAEEKIPDSSEAVSTTSSNRVRQEVRAMPRADQERYVQAVKQMISNGEWFRIAGYHGWPSNGGRGYCAHRAEHFPGWHRAYLLEMETALMKADQEVGNDGNIAHPYWDFSSYEIEVDEKKIVVPEVIYEQFGPEFRFSDEFFQGQTDGRLYDIGFRGLRDPAQLSMRLDSSSIMDNVRNCLDLNANFEHWMHASTENRRRVSVETPHNNCHNALGFPLTSLSYAAFHPMFWLLHCNVDRIYQAYVEARGVERCKEDIFKHQNAAAQFGNTNLMEEDLDPFKKPNGEPFRILDTLSTIDYGYSYDRLPPIPGQSLRELPTYILFPNVDVVYKLIDRDGNMKSFSLHLFVIPKAAFSESESSSVLPTLDDVRSYFESSYYAGIVGAFAGKGPKCKNCAETKPVNLQKDITAKLTKLGVSSRHDVIVRTIAEDELGEICMLEELQAKYGENCYIPAASIVGPVFENQEDSFAKTNDSAFDSHVQQLQKVLAKFGYDTGEIDGIFGTQTESAVTTFQNLAGLTSDGVVGPITKRQLVAPLNDGVPHTSGGGDKQVFPPGSTVKYFIGPTTAGLNDSQFAGVIASCLSQWAAVTSLNFEPIDNRSDAMLTILFGTASEGDSDLLHFDGPGGELARCIDTTVTFDSSERYDSTKILSSSVIMCLTFSFYSWALRADQCSSSDHFNIEAVALHEIGHALVLII